MATLSTLAGWTAIIAIAGLYYYLTKEKQQQRGRRLTVTKQPVKPIESREKPKSKKLRKDNDDDAKLGKKDQKKSSQVAKPENEKPVTTPKINKKEDDEEMSNRRFARELANAKNGTILAAKTEVGGRQRSVKQSKAQEKPATFDTSSERATASSSATGGDADDDQSSTNSPEMTATALDTPVANGGISDMLEAPAPGPSILRITEPTNPTKPKKSKAPAAFEAVETKKQRQNRKKAEAKKFDREDEEKDRKTLMEKQRRAAREAEGRAAKDGSSFMAAKSLSSSAWTPEKQNNGDKGKGSALLDTFTPTALPAKPKGPVVPDDYVYPVEYNYSESEIFGSDWAKVSEEEQVAYAVEDSKNWQTVVGKEKKKGKKGAGSNDEASDSNASKPSQKNYGVPPKIEPTGPGQKWDMTVVHVEKNGEVVERDIEVQDSEWQVS